MKKKTVFKWLNRFVTGVLMILLIGVAFLAVTAKLTGGDPQVFGYQLKTVLSGSMEPDIQTGSVIAVKPIADEQRGDLKKGDVITFMESEDKLVTHRIVDSKTTGNGVIYTTKGDNNNAADSSPVLAENVVAVYSGVTIPYVGYISSFAQSPNGSIAFLIVPGLLMLGYSGFTIWRAIRELDDQKNKPVDVPNS
ncbi:signal peptidase I SipW [Oceanobacillus bengalensis]|uniref:Signal peptidase I n=1 Tax=Oceanobacillus bengalensis TaxID=1435466 RepID=A0A494Z6M6_9BACI|nr:signal peptidase I [Oceanobacillus bengalensis]RKQ18203.1 signal peptidase I [Oceanobacillus bengalensis]